MGPASLDEEDESVEQAASALVPPGNVTANPSFESGTSNWIGWQSSISRVALAGAPDGSHVAKVTRRAGTAYTIDDEPASVASTVGGRTYTGSAFVRAASKSSVGKPSNVTLRERNASGAVVRQTTSSTLTLSSTFQRISVSAPAAGSGNKLEVYLSQSNAARGDAFYADLITLVPDGTTTTTPSPEPTPEPTPEPSPEPSTGVLLPPGAPRPTRWASFESAFDAGTIWNSSGDTSYVFSKEKGAADGATALKISASCAPGSNCFGRAHYGVANGTFPQLGPGSDIWWGASFYLPSGGTSFRYIRLINIGRWVDGATNNKMIGVFLENGCLNLKVSYYHASPTMLVSKCGVVPRDRWFSIAVHTRFGMTNAFSELFVDAVSQGTSTTQNMTDSNAWNFMHGGIPNAHTEDTPESLYLDGYWWGQ